MERVEYLWDAIQYLTKFQCSEANRLQCFYVERCRSQAREVKLPKSCFGPMQMCTRCGALWATTEHQVRILPGKKISRSVGKMIKTNTEGHNVSKVQAKLIRKCKKNEKNKISIKCSVCSHRTEIQLTKPKRKVTIPHNESLEKSKSLHKKKKRKAKDKTAGLNISEHITPKSRSSESNKTLVASNASRSKIKKNLNTQKSKKLNISKLKDVIKQGMTPPNRRSLTNFLKELV